MTVKRSREAQGKEVYNSPGSGSYLPQHLTLVPESKVPQASLAKYLGFAELRSSNIKKNIWNLVLCAIKIICIFEGVIMVFS